jgi:putative transcriptional regulator
MHVAENIRKLRRGMGYSQPELAREMNVQPGTICNWETGRRSPRMFYVRKLVELANKFKIKFNIEDFLN